MSQSSSGWTEWVEADGANYFRLVIRDVDAEGMAREQYDAICNGVALIKSAMAPAIASSREQESDGA